LFFGFPQGTAETAAQPAAASAAQKPADTNFFTTADQQDAPALRMAAPAAQTDFVSRHTHPQEVVARAMALPGVAGAVVALADGLRVASNVPATQNADAVAAFLPQIFERVNQNTRELRMGALNNVGFTVGNVPWKIFRVNSIYFAAFGRANESLPKAQLAGLATELDRKNQK
jgi:predicted regulator of Ras-like GTPase activity (Roadblock/LC7/MglB family)